jgi:hypothetical protein
VDKNGFWCTQDASGEERWGRRWPPAHTREREREMGAEKKYFFIFGYYFDTL